MSITKWWKEDAGLCRRTFHAYGTWHGAWSADTPRVVHRRAETTHRKKRAFHDAEGYDNWFVSIQYKTGNSASWYARPVDNKNYVRMSEMI